MSTTEAIDTGISFALMPGYVLDRWLFNRGFSRFADDLLTVNVFGWELTLPNGTADIVVGTLMAVVLILRPSGLTGGREFSLPRRRKAVVDLEKARVTT